MIICTYERWEVFGLISIWLACIVPYNEEIVDAYVRWNIFIKLIYIEYFWSFHKHFINNNWQKKVLTFFCRRHVDIIAYPFESKVAGLMTQQYFTLAFLLSSVLPVCSAQWDHIISEGAFWFAWISVFKRNFITFLALCVVLWFFSKTNLLTQKIINALSEIITTHRPQPQLRRSFFDST